MTIFRIGDIAAFSKGASVPRDRMNIAGDYLYLHYGDLYKGHRLYIDTNQPRKAIPYISSQEKVRDDQFARNNDIIYILTSETIEDLGKALLLKCPQKETVVAGTETTIMRVLRPDLVLPAYLNYMTQSDHFKRVLRQYVTGMKVFRVHPRDIAQIEIDIPSLSVQRAIVSLLDSFHEAIVLNNRINDYLTALTSTMYEDFCSHASGKKGTLADLVELRKDSTKAGKHPELPYMPIDVIPMKSMNVTGFRPNDEAKSSLQLFQCDDIVIGAMRVYFHRVVIAPCDGITRNTCFVLRPRTQFLREYALLTCFQPEAIEYANVRSKGSTMPYAVWDNSLETYPVLVPNESELDTFSKRLAPIVDQLRDSYKANSCLVEIRDTLLPKLMSGEIDVSKVDITQLNNHLYDC